MRTLLQIEGLVTLTFDLLTLKMVSESRVTWATSVPILVFLGLSVLEYSLFVLKMRLNTNYLTISRCQQVTYHCPQFESSKHMLLYVLLVILLYNIILIILSYY